MSSDIIRVPIRCLVVLLTTVLNAPLSAREVVFPADAGVVDVRRDFGARGDGRTDDTAALQAALDRYPSGNKIIYLPTGTYVISDTLRWPVGNGGGNTAKRTILQGQAEQKSILRLGDACPGFTDPAQPKSMLWTGKAPAQRFRNAVRDLTVDTGKGNPGAIGVQFIANNQETRGNDTRTLRKGETPGRGGGSALPLFVSPMAQETGDGGREADRDEEQGR